MDEYDRYLEERDKQELRNFRFTEQKRENDYSYEEKGNIELCGDCRSPINSHGHCPRCDY